MPQIIRIPSDGNCLFRAISEALSLGEYGHKLLRAVAVNYIKSQRARFEGFNDTDSPWEEYIQNLSQEGEWAGERVLLALSELYTINILVHTPEHMDSPRVFIVDNPLKTVHQSLPPTTPLQKFRKCFLWHSQIAKVRHCRR